VTGARTFPAGVLIVEMSRFASYGGTKHVAVNLASVLDRTRFDPTVLFYRSGPWVADLDAAGVTTIVAGNAPRDAAVGAAEAGSAGRAAAQWSGGGAAAAPERPLHRRVAADLRSWWWLLGRDAARARRLLPLVPPGTRLIHVNHSMATDFTWYHVARTLGIPVVTHEHGIWKPRSAAYYAVASQVASVLCLTEERVAQLRERLHARVHADLLPNGIPVDRFVPERDRGAVRAEFGIPDGAPLIITAGHVQEWKGQALAVAAAQLLAARGMDFVWLLCGEIVEKAYAEGLRERIEQAGLGARVRLTGQRRDLHELFAASDIAVHTSIQPEPFGLVVIEAMLQGVPVIGPREGAIPELIRDRVDGLLVPPRDPESLANAIRDLADAPEARREMGRRASVKVRESFDIHLQARRLEAIYDRVLSGAPRDAAGGRGA
jgi:glycosyltransferase involved in cell wall biosynthesis